MPGFSKRVEKSGGNREIALTSNFSFSQCFRKKMNEDTCNPGLVWERVQRVFVRLNPCNANTRAPHAGANAQLWGA